MHAKVIFKDKDFFELPLEVIRDILKSDWLNAKESQVFEAMMAWVL
jgi:hypothetical protein